MTVCVGAICNEGDTVIVASDRMMTATMPPIKFEHTKPKIFPISNSCVALTAGNALLPVEIIPQIKALLTKASSIPQIAEQTKNIYQLLRAKHAEDIFLLPRTITKEVFYSRGAAIFPPDLFNAIDRDFTSFNFGFDLMLAGVDQEAHLYGITNPGFASCYDSISFHAIGIGHLHAIQVFIAHKYKTSYDIEEAVSVVYAAKKAAEAAPGVGQETDICIITQDSIINLVPEMIDELSNIYNEVRKSPVEEIKEKSKRLKTLLKKMEEKENASSK